MAETNAGAVAPATAAAAPKAAEPGPNKLPLTKPIEAHGEMLKELTFREPSGLDILRIGNPVIFDIDTGEIRHDERKLIPMIAALASIPPSSVLELDSRDLISAAWRITPFFLPRPGAV